MNRTGANWLLILCWLLAWPCRGCAEQSIASTDASGFGRSIELSGPWLAAAGEDARWALPNFDDRQWTSVRKTEPLSQQGLGNAKSLWYRTHVQLPTAAVPAAVYVEGELYNYTLFVNGRQIGRQGVAGDDGINQHSSEGFTIPWEVIASARGELVVVMHFSGGPVGFLDLPPLTQGTRVLLVSPADVALRRNANFAQFWSEPIAVMALNFLVAFCGLTIWWSLRSETEYLALGIWPLCNALATALLIRMSLQHASPLGVGYLVHSLLQAAGAVAELEFMRLLLRLRRSWLWITLETVMIVVLLLDPLVARGVLPITFLAGQLIIGPFVMEFFVGAMLLRGVWSGNRDASLLLLPVALWSLSDIYMLANIASWLVFKRFLPVLPSYHLFSYVVSIQGAAEALGVLCLVLIILRRTIRLSREKAELSTEIAAAEELQGLLMARASRPMPGFRVETEYRPMQQVGGDFFLVQPCEEDNTLVAIVGDVSGKGLQAAMRVSMILGVLQREVMGQPDRVLRKLNTALLAQGDLGFTTACCVRLEADGRYCFANAGHLNPYVERRELESEGALPLGIDPEATYAVSCGRLLPGQRMVLLSDGVIEARSKKGELFGFERTRELVSMDASAMADVAQRFGQDDDITVLSLALA